MNDSTERRNGLAWLHCFPLVGWLAGYRAAWVQSDVIAGVTLAAYAIPVSLAYRTCRATTASRCVRLFAWCLGYALFGSSRQLAIGPTSAISLMIAGTVGAMAEGDAHRYAQIASLVGLLVAMLCLVAWLLRLSSLVKLIRCNFPLSVGFKAGAALTIAMTQLPSLLGVSGGGDDFFERAFLLVGQLGQTHYVVLILGIIAITLLVLGERFLPGKPIALGVVALSILAATVLGLPALGVSTTGAILPVSPRLKAHRCGYAIPGDFSAGCRMPPTRLYRKRFSRSHLRGEAWIQPRPETRTPRNRRCKLRGGFGAGVSGSRWPFSICCKRPGRRAHAPGSCPRVGYACPLFTVSDRPLEIYRRRH